MLLKNVYFNLFATDWKTMGLRTDIYITETV